MACDKGFSSSYFLLKPEEVGFFDLVHILFSSNVEEGRYADYSKSEGTVTDDTISFRRRWLMFISILAQKFLQLVSKPLSVLGSATEMCLNLLSSNRNIFVLILNSFRGKLVKPDKSSAIFLSFIGNMDKRLKLDSSIKHDDANYHAALSMMASKASYENKTYIETTVNDHWKMEFLGFYDFWNGKKLVTYHFIINKKPQHKPSCFVIKLVTVTPLLWPLGELNLSTPMHGAPTLTSHGTSFQPGLEKIHGGFMKALGLQKNVGWPKEIKKEDGQPAVAYYAIREMLKEILSQNDQARYIVTGHSLGGALAILFPAVLALHNEAWLLERLQGVYTFGQPRVGDEKFGEFMREKLKEHGIRYFRFVYGNDMVPRLPYDDKDLMFKHFGTCLYYNRQYEVKVVAEEPNKNYFSPLGAIPMMTNAFCELIRSFTISRTKGPDYKEGSFLRIFRVIGLVLPGVPAHSTQDYVNATRLGSSNVFLPPRNIPQEV